MFMYGTCGCISGGKIGGCIGNILTSYIFICVPKNGGPKCPEGIICGGPGKFGIGRPCFDMKNVRSIGGLYGKVCTLAGCCCRFFVLFPLFLLLLVFLLFPTVLFTCCDCL